MASLSKHLTLICLVLIVLQATAQEQASIWYFGDHAGLDFRNGAPVPLDDSAMDTREGCATIADTNGNLLFYTDGSTVWNKNHDPVPNGTDLNGDTSSTQSAIIVPKSDEPNIYYIFTIMKEQGPEGLQYSVFDLSLDGGLGAVTAQKNIVLRAGPLTEKVTAVENAGGNGVWVITKDFGSNAFLSYLVDAAGIHTTPVISNVGYTPDNSYLAGFGYIKASSNGEFLATASHEEGDVELFRFDTATGVVSDPLSLQDFFKDAYYKKRAYGVEFSTNNQLLYISSLGGVYQFDISTYDEAAIMASGILLSPTYNLPPFVGAMQMGLDGKIYITRLHREFLMVINNPNVPGPGCNFVENGLTLAPGTSGILGLPTFITSYFAVGIQADQFCLGSETDFSVNVTEPITGISWDFGDGATATLETPSHEYTAPGTYTVTVQVTTATESSSATKEITIFEVPVANVATDIAVCSANTTYGFDLSLKDAEVLGTQDPADFQVTYFATLADAESNTDPLSTPYTNTSAVETRYARIQNRHHPECFDTTSFDLVVQRAPQVNTQADWTACDTDMDGLFTFDLSKKATTILEGNDPLAYSVSFYPSQMDLDNGTNEIPTLYTNTLSREEIFWKIQNDTYPDCYGEGTFFLEVTSGVRAHPPSSIEVCDDDNDGLFTFNLTQMENEILGTQNPASIQISYHPTLMDATAGTNALESNYTNTTPYNETIFVRAENTADPACFDTTSFEVQISDSPMLRDVTDWRVCDTDNDGLHRFDLQTKVAEILGGASSSEFTVRFYETQMDADSETHAIVAPYENTTNPQTLFYRVANTHNPRCYVTDSFHLEVDGIPVANTAVSIEVCDANRTGTHTFDLSSKDAEVLGGQSTAAYTVAYFTTEVGATTNSNPLSKTAYVNTALQETIYARIQNNANPECFAISSFDIRISPLPQPNLEPEYVICPDSPELQLDGGDFERWSWRYENGMEIGTDRSIAIETLGNYMLTVSQTENGLRCENTVDFEVISSGAPEDFTTEIGDFSDVVSITVNVTGTGNFEYSADGETYQDGNRLEVFPGIHTIYVRDTYLCRTISKEVVALGYQKFFTPNNDTINEYWNIIGADLYPDSKLFIYDRYGRLLKQLDPDGLGWDGTFNGLQMPSSDYWFHYFYGDGKEFSGHFSLKR